MIDWELPVGNAPEVARIADVTPRAIYHLQELGFIPTRGSRAVRVTGVTTTSAVFMLSMVKFGLTPDEAFAAWNEAALLIFNRRLYPTAGQENEPPLSAAFWRQPDGSVAGTPYVRGEILDERVMAALREAAGAGRPIIQIDLDAMFDTVERRIREFCPDCPAVRGRPALRVVEQTAPEPATVH